jgi:hypothetical protein
MFPFQAVNIFERGLLSNLRRERSAWNVNGYFRLFLMYTIFGKKAVTVNDGCSTLKAVLAQSRRTAGSPRSIPMPEEAEEV